MTSPRIVAHPAARFFASRISSCSSSAAMRQPSSTSSSGAAAAISSSLSSHGTSSTLEYQRRGMSSNSNKSMIGASCRSTRQNLASGRATMTRPSSLLSTHQFTAVALAQQRQSYVTCTTYLQASAEQQPAAAAASEEDECPPWQNPLHHNNPEYTRVLESEFAPGEEMPITPLPPFEDDTDEDKVSAPPHLHDLADQIVRLNMLEVKELVDRIGDHFGFTDDDEYMDDGEGGDGAAAAAEEAKVEKTAFDLKLTGFDAKAKIKVIKEIRGLTSLGLKEAKELVEGAPTTVKKDIKMEEAEELKAKLEAVGATVEIV